MQSQAWPGGQMRQVWCPPILGRQCLIITAGNTLWLNKHQLFLICVDLFRRRVGIRSFIQNEKKI